MTFSHHPSPKPKGNSTVNFKSLNVRVTTRELCKLTMGRTTTCQSERGREKQFGFLNSSSIVFFFHFYCIFYFIYSFICCLLSKTSNWKSFFFSTDPLLLRLLRGFIGGPTFKDSVGLKAMLETHSILTFWACFFHFFLF